MSKPSDEWYTPEDIAEATYRLFGDFFDPCGREGTPVTTYASAYFDYRAGQGDALVDVWPEDLASYVNFPYSDPGPFVDALLRNDPYAWVVVCNASTAAAWFQTLCEASTALIFPKQRIRFLREPLPDQPSELAEAAESPWGLVQPKSPRYNNAVFFKHDDPYFAKDFFEVFGGYGQGALLR